MYRQAKDICTCILLCIFITCTNALSCYSCYGDIKNALDCEIINCKASLFGELGTSCYYVTNSNYQRRGCEDIISLSSQHNKTNNIKLHYCREDYCNGFSDVFLNDSRRQYKSKEAQVTDLKQSWNTLDSYSISTWHDNQKPKTLISKTDLTLLFTAISVTIFIVACLCFCKRTNKPQNKFQSRTHESCSRNVYTSQSNHYDESSHGMDDYFFYANNISSNAIANHSHLNTHFDRHDSTGFKHCDDGSNNHSDTSCHVGGSSHHNDCGDGHYSYSDNNYCGGNDFDGGAGDCGGGDGGDDCCGGGDD